MPNLDQQKAKANAFRMMHSGNNILLLPNAWDVATARIIEEAGFPAIATTSAGVAFSLGYPDGQKISREEMLARVARIVRSVKVPVTADVEAGYGDSPDDAAETARQVVEAGAVGLNFEDGTGEPRQPLVDVGLQTEKIRAIREAVLKTGVLLVLNLRVDVYLDQVGSPETRYDETIRRGLAYRDAGADCIFVPGVRDAETIARLVHDLHCPVNILAGPGSLPVAELERLGVARLTLGSAPMRATLGLLQRMAKELKTTGTYVAIEGAPAHGDVNKLMQRQ